MSEPLSTPDRLTSMLDITETMNALSEMQLLESPKSTQLTKSSRSRLRAGTKGRTLFSVEPTEKVNWTDNEAYALVLFMMLYTDGKR